MALNSNFRTLTADNIEGIVDEKNYLRSSFENGTISGWREMAVTVDANGFPNATPTIGTNASPNAASSLSLSATSTTPLSGARSLLVTVPTSLSQGQGFISEEFTLDRMDLGKVLTVSFDYERISGTYNFSGTRGSQTWMVYIYDASVGGATWIQPAGFLGMNQSSGPGRVACTFQSSVTAGQKYRVAVIAHQAASGASSIEFDNFTCSRQTAPIGPVMSDWVSYTPTITGFGTVAFQSFRSRRVGDTLEIEGYFQAGTVSAATASFTIGYNGGNGNVSIDNPGKIVTNAVVGRVGYNQSSSTFFGAYVLCTSSGNTLNFSAQSSTVNNLATSVSGNFFVSGSVLQLNASVPISGWSSNVQLSNDTDTRVVAAAYLRSTAQTIPAATDTTVIYDTRRIDTHGAMNTSTGRFTAPVSGVYRISGSVFYNFFTPAAGNPLQMRFVKRSVAGVALEDTYKDNFTANAAVGQEIALRTTALFYCNAGETLEVILWQNTGASRTTIANINYVEIERLSGPSVVAASETVAARYFTSAGPVINNTQPIITYGSKVYDSHNAMSGNTYTVPVSGKYRVTQQIFTASSSFTAGTIVEGVVRKNSVNNAVLGGFRTPALLTGTIHTTGSAELDCVAGDQLTFAIYSDVASSLGTTPAGVYNFVTISRIGN